MSSPAPDAGIPLLTEIIPNEDDGAPFAQVAATGANGASSVAGPGASPALNEDQWARLERDIRERIVNELHARVDTLIEQRIKENLGEMLQVVMKVMAQELRVTLHQALDDIVTKAVATELSSLRE